MFMYIKKFIRFSALILSCLVLGNLQGCQTAPPQNINNVCSIFFEKEDWYQYSKEAFTKWGVPIHVQMAILYQESKFRADAVPKHKTGLNFIPWLKSSSAYGYSQAIDSTWDWYREKTGNYGADRESFEDSVDFICWYLTISHEQLGLSKWDTANQYLAYHEGHTGYKRKTYEKKIWLQKVAHKVDKQAKLYSNQLNECQEELDNQN